MVASVAVPAVNESLVGWIERTSHYTGGTPLRLARDLGLVKKDGRLGYLEMSPEKALELCELWSGAPASAEALTLRGQYSALDHWQNRYQHSARHLASRAWVYLSGSRYCPQCLGESGVWKLDWKLPWIACCVEHRIELADRCPHCQDWPRSDRRGTAEHLLQDRAATHPAICKRPVGPHRSCGGNLADSPRRDADSEIVSATRMVQQVMGGNPLTLAGEQVDCVDVLRSWVEISLLALAATSRTSQRQRLSAPRDVIRCRMLITLAYRIFQSGSAEEAADCLRVVVRGGSKSIDANWVRDVLPRQRTEALRPVTAALLEGNGRLSTRLRRQHVRFRSQGEWGIEGVHTILEGRAQLSMLQKPNGVSETRWEQFLRLVVGYATTGRWQQAAESAGLDAEDAWKIKRHVTNRLDASQRNAVINFVADLMEGRLQANS